MKCKCGCNRESNCKNGFYRGHWNKGRKRPDLIKRNLEDNPMKNPEIAKKAGIKPDNYKVWNKGLSIDDERVKKYVEKRNKNLKEIGNRISKTKKKKYASGEIKSYWKGKNRGEDFREKMRKSTLERIKRQGTHISYNENSIPFFKEINNNFNLQALYGKNEYMCKGYSLDFYSKKHNLVIEWDEEGHYKNDELLEKDKKRQKIIEKHLNCRFLRIRELYFNKEKIIENIKKHINENISR
jgi:very-short-patch-repair endonuclease